MESKELKPNFDFESIGVNANDLNNEVEKLSSQSLSDIEILIRNCEIDLNKELPPPPIAMRIESNSKQITLFTKGNFSIVTGKAKSRKSFLISMLMAGAIKGNFQNHFLCPFNGMNILFDTEQAEYKVQQTSKRICKLAGVENPLNFKAFHLRTLDPVERLELIETVLSSTPNLNFVAIDGIVDLDIDPILQAEQAQNIISKLMKWTENYNIHIVCVLHYNKTVSTLLGHLGSFAHRKADAIIEVVKDTESENISFVNPVDCREMEFKEFAFSVDEFGVPKIETEFEFSKSKSAPKADKTKVIEPADFERKAHLQILQESFKVFKKQSYSDLWKVLKQAINSYCSSNPNPNYKNSIGDNKAKEFVTYYLQNELILKIDESKKTFYVLNEPILIDFDEVV